MVQSLSFFSSVSSINWLNNCDKRRWWVIIVPEPFYPLIDKIHAPMQPIFKEARHFEWPVNVWPWPSAEIWLLNEWKDNDTQENKDIFLLRWTVWVLSGHNGQWPPTKKNFYPRFYPLLLIFILTTGTIIF